MTTTLDRPVDQHSVDIQNSHVDGDSFSLHALVREVLAGPLASPGDIAVEVLSRIPPDHYRDALATCLREYVRIIGHKAPTTGGAERVSGPSKADGVRDWWTARLAKNLQVGPDPSAWKKLGACTYEDLLFVAAERHRIASEIQAEAERYDLLAKLVKRHKVATVAELPEDALVDVFSDAA